MARQLQGTIGQLMYKVAFFHFVCPITAKLKKYKNDPGIVLAVPRVGVLVAYAVAKELVPIEVVLTKKIGHPMHKEYAIGICYWRSKSY